MLDNKVPDPPAEGGGDEGDVAFPQIVTALEQNVTCDSALFQESLWNSQALLFRHRVVRVRSRLSEEDASLSKELLDKIEQQGFEQVYTKYINAKTRQDAKFLGVLDQVLSSGDAVKDIADSNAGAMSTENDLVLPDLRDPASLSLMMSVVPEMAELDAHSKLPEAMRDAWIAQRFLNLMSMRKASFAHVIPAGISTEAIKFLYMSVLEHVAKEADAIRTNLTRKPPSSESFEKIEFKPSDAASERALNAFVKKIQAACVTSRLPQWVVTALQDQLLPFSYRPTADQLVVQMMDSFVSESQANLSRLDAHDRELVQHVEARLQQLEAKPFRVGTSIAEVIFYFLKLDHVESFEAEYNLLRYPPRQKENENVQAFANRAKSEYYHIGEMQMYSHLATPRFSEAYVDQVIFFGLRKNLFLQVTKEMALLGKTLIPGTCSTGSESAALDVISMDEFLKIADKQDKFLQLSNSAGTQNKASGKKKPNLPPRALNELEWNKKYYGSVAPASQNDPLAHDRPKLGQRRKDFPNLHRFKERKAGAARPQDVRAEVVRRAETNHKARNMNVKFNQMQLAAAADPDIEGGPVCLRCMLMHGKPFVGAAHALDQCTETLDSTPGPSSTSANLSF